MFRNYIKTAYRSLVRNKVYSILNILGLTIGISCFSLIIIHLESDFSYDQFHENESFRLLYRQDSGDGDSRVSGIARIATGQELADNVSGITDKLFLRDFAFFPVVLNYKDKHIKTNKSLFAEENFFDYFSFDLHQGNPETALSDPTGLVITESLATRIFGQVNPMGEFIEFSGPFDITLQVTGVMEDTKNTHFDFDFIFPYKMQVNGRGVAENWFSHSIYTYYKIENNTDAGSVETRIKDYLLSTRTGADLEYTKKETPILQSVKDIYFNSGEVSFDEAYKKGDKQNLLILGAIGAFILLVACINYVNISTAKAMTRAKEIGVRKVLGAMRKQLIGQFMGEAFIVTLIALLLSILISDLTMPGLNNILGKAPAVEMTQNPFYYKVLGALLIGVTLISGLYPAFVLSTFRPTESLKGKGAGLLRGRRMRQGLIALQLFVTLVLISSVIFVMKQANYINRLDLGFDKENIINIPLNSRQVGRSLETYRAELMRNPNVLGVTVGTDAMGFGSTNNSFYAIPEGKKLEEGVMSTYFSVGMDFLDVHGMEVVQGRKFDPQLSTDSVSLIVNETLAESLGLEDPVGKKIKIWGEDASPQTIIGVVKDFNFQSLHNEVNPALFTVARRNFWNLTVRTSAGSSAEVLKYAEEQWQAIDPSYPFEFQFVDDLLDNFYQSENRMLGVIQAFAIICIVIACMGLYGMTAFTIEQKIKEIGIRKVLGAGVNHLVWLVNQKFVWLFVLAALVSVPLVYYMATEWFKGFAFHTNIDVWTFVGTGALVLFIVLLTVSAQAIKAAWLDPAKTLRYE